MIQPGESSRHDKEHSSSDEGDRPPQNPPSNKDREPPTSGPSDDQPALPRGYYQTDTFYDRYAAFFSPKTVHLKPEILAQLEDFEQRFQGILRLPAEDYSDAEISSRISNYQGSEGRGISRIAEINDKSGAYYLPPLNSMNGDEPLQSEKFTTGEVRMLHQLVMQKVSDDELRLRNRVNVFYDQNSLEEAILHMRESLIHRMQPHANGGQEPPYSHLKLIMQQRMLHSLMSLEPEKHDSLFGESPEISMKLLDVSTKPLPNGLVLQMSMITEPSSQFLHCTYRLVLDRVGKLTIEDLGIEIE